jgi:hypothetical protein
MADFAHGAFSATRLAVVQRGQGQLGRGECTRSLKIAMSVTYAIDAALAVTAARDSTVVEARRRPMVLSVSRKNGKHTGV